MKRITYPSADIPRTSRVIALGFFDGIHLGHRAVLREALEQADMAGCAAAAFTFDDLPKAHKAGRLLSDADTDALLTRMELDELFVGQFTALRDLSPEDFVRRVLREQLGAQAVVCGFNYHFGQNGAGDAARLCVLGAQCGMRVTVLPPVLADGEPISSTRIRAAVAAGDLLLANRLLGHPLTIHAPVIDGHHLGRTLGTPTINQPLADGLTLPAFGVYASAVEVAGHVTYGVTNIGVKPTVGSECPLAETWIPEFEGDLYGKAVPVTPTVFLRPERKFPSVEALRERITADGERTRRLFVGEEPDAPRAVLFDFDDTLQNCALAFLNFFRAFVRRRFPDLPPAEQETRALQMAHSNQNGYVPYATYVEQMQAQYDWAAVLNRDEIVQAIWHEFPRFTTLLPGVAEGLRALRAQGWRLGIVTNGYSQIQNRKLDICGLRPLFDGIVISGDEDVHKPDPEIFRRAAARIGVAPARCIFVGDHPVNDIEGAGAAGMRPVFMQASGRFAPPDGVPVIRSMDELLARLPEFTA